MSAAAPATHNRPDGHNSPMGQEAMMKAHDRIRTALRHGPRPDTAEGLICIAYYMGREAGAAPATPRAETVEILIETPAYNERRYGLPWIALVDFSKSPKGDFAFGAWIGQPGESGTLRIEATAGAIVATGQRDYMGKSSCDYYMVEKSGALRNLSKSEAYAAWRAQQDRTVKNPLAKFSTGELLGELRQRDADA